MKHFLTAHLSWWTIFLLQPKKTKNMELMQWPELDQTSTITAKSCKPGTQSHWWLGTYCWIIIAVRPKHVGVVISWHLTIRFDSDSEVYDSIIVHQCINNYNILHYNTLWKYVKNKRIQFSFLSNLSFLCHKRKSCS